MRLSLHGRLLVAASLVLAAFLGLTGAALDRAFRSSAEQSLMQRLQAQVYGLLAAAELNDDGTLQLPPDLPEARFSRPDSGLYAAILTNGGGWRWSSPSLLGRNVKFPDDLPPGQWRSSHMNGSANLNAESFGVSWELNGKAYDFTVSVGEDAALLEAQVAGFRRSLWGWLGGAALLLLAVQGSILRWGLAPLRRAERELNEVESGRRESLGGRYPRELTGLTHSINDLIRQERAHLERYRKALADLAHSLKTPLAVLRAAAPDESLLPTVQEQVARMDGIVGYQLRRAAASGSAAFATPLPVEPNARKITNTLAKVYRDKAPRFTLEVTGDASFRGDAGDLLEMLGNLLDNACKWCRGEVCLRARPLHPQQPAHRAGLELTVEDDGPGIREADRERVLERGGRADSATPGHGIGLAVVRELVETYGGSLTLDRSPLGGARFTLRFGSPAGAAG